MYFKINIANKIRSYTYPIQLILQSWKVILINLGKLISPVDHHRCKYIRTSCPGTVGWHCHLVVIFCCSHCPLHAYWGDVEGIWVSLGTYYLFNHSFHNSLDYKVSEGGTMFFAFLSLLYSVFVNVEVKTYSGLTQLRISTNFFISLFTSHTPNFSTPTRAWRKTDNCKNCSETTISFCSHDHITNLNVRK